MPMGVYPRRSAIDRVLGKTLKTETCWLMTAGIAPNGYAYIRVACRSTGVHRLAWELAAGDIPAEFEVCHTCDTRACWRNDDVGFYEVNGILRPRRGHLWLGTRADNLADMTAKGRRADGDRNGARIHRDRMPRGDAHPSRLRPDFYLRGERNPGAKLTAEDARTIRTRHAAGGVSWAKLAREYGVATGTIQDLIQRRTWRHVE